MAAAWGWPYVTVWSGHIAAILRHWSAPAARILVIDDEFQIRRFLRINPASQGYDAASRHRRTGTATSGDTSARSHHSRRRPAAKNLRLTRTEYDVLKMLFVHRDRVVTQKQMLKEIWAPTHTEDTHYLPVIVGSPPTKNW